MLAIAGGGDDVERRGAESRVHVAAFPEELPAFLIKLYTDKGDRVLDPFLGSGTTLKVARTMGRKGIGYEINSGYKDLIREKILEPWEVPDWKKLDLFHSTTMKPGTDGKRKVQFTQTGLSSLLGLSL